MPSAIARKMITISWVRFPVSVYAATERHRSEQDRCEEDRARLQEGTD